METYNTPQLDLDGLTAHLSAQPDVLLAYLFGSTARGQANTLSDVDVAVLLQEKADRADQIERQLQLAIDLEAFSERDLQVVLLNDAPPLLAYEVIRDGRLLCQRDDMTRINFVVRAMKTYFDIQPMLEFHNQALLRQIQEVGLGYRKQRSSRTLEAAERIHQRLIRPASN